jgi:putative tricarboxylic transport membrane protein
VVSMWIGNVFLLILNLPLIGLWVRMISVPYHLLYPAIMVFCAIGVFSISNTTFDVYLMALFGLLGFVFMKLGCEPTPLLLGFILGPPMEEHLRRAMVLSEGRADVLLREPLSACLLAIAALLLASVLLPAVRKKREATFISEG